MENAAATRASTLSICASANCRNSSNNNKLGIGDSGKQAVINGGGRRQLALASTAGLVLVAVAAASASAESESDSKTKLLDRYLKKSQENKAKNDKERLDSYYKRNYKDYFESIEGTLRQKDNKDLTQSEKAILEWLDSNRN
ncbi:uncharacterized protein LOC127241496 isoform X1 [Andrographis paniculata]|uniref:uncharacterized protein LOC127241496 isoform X1 n=1 Tax=Andrographis paniculata TaxID=175694 RepID=UPI0021E8ABE2|nr:uncharacterized protein LOC127241496 isoform X1 [Andrographis paniculata]